MSPPAYDLTFSSGPSGEHCSLVMSEGKNSKLMNLLMLAEIGGIKKQRALQIIEEVNRAIAKWNNFAQEAGVSSTSLKIIQAAIDLVAKNLYS